MYYKEDLMSVFYENGRQNIIISEGVKTLDMGSYCASLRNYKQDEVTTNKYWDITIPAGVEKISSSAFDYEYGRPDNACIRFKQINNKLYFHPTAIDRPSFNCEIHIPDIKSWSENVVRQQYVDYNWGEFEHTVESDMYLDGEKIEHLVIPKGTKIIEDGAFSHITSLVSVTVAHDVESIGDYAFYGCKNLKSVYIGSGVKSIGKQAFYGCTQLEDIKFAEGVRTTENSESLYCASLTPMIVPQGITSIGDYAFGGCKLLKIEILPDDPKKIMQSFARCYKLTNDSEEGSIEVGGVGNIALCNVTKEEYSIIDQECQKWHLNVYGAFWDEGENGPAGHYDYFNMYIHFRPENCILTDGKVIGFVHETYKNGEYIYIPFLIADYKSKKPEDIPKKQMDVSYYHLELCDKKKCTEQNN